MADGILGTDFLSERNVNLNLEKLQLKLQKGSSVKHTYANQ